MFLAVEPQTYRVYISPHRQGLFIPSELSIRGRKIRRVDGAEIDASEGTANT